MRGCSDRADGDRGRAAGDHLGRRPNWHAVAVLAASAIHCLEKSGWRVGGHRDYSWRYGVAPDECLRRLPYAPRGLIRRRGRGSNATADTPRPSDAADGRRSHGAMSGGVTMSGHVAPGPDGRRDGAWLRRHTGARRGGPRTFDQPGHCSNDACRSRAEPRRDLHHGIPATKAGVDSAS